MEHLKVLYTKYNEIQEKEKTMTISELIANLENLRAEHGDLDVIVDDTQYDMGEIDIECEGLYGKKLDGTNIGRKVVKFSFGGYAV